MSRAISLTLVVALLVLLPGPLFSATPALAQGSDPATYLPADSAIYFEMRVDENLEANLQELIQMGLTLSGAPSFQIEQTLEQASFDALLGNFLPDVSFENDIFPWLNGQVGVAVLDDPDTPDVDNFIAAVPIIDNAAADAFLSGLSLPLGVPRTAGDASVYDTPWFQLAVAPDIILVGTPLGVERALDVRGGNSPALVNNSAFLQTWTALPAHPLMAGYISGDWFSQNFTRDMIPSDEANARMVFDLVLRGHPAESPMEDALLKYPDLNGVGFAFEMTPERLDLTMLASLDAQYPGPVLPTAGAGAELLPYIPGNSYVVFDSYDLMSTQAGLIGPIVVLSLLGPSISNIFGEIVAELEGTPRPTPTPTPVPSPTPTPDEILSQINDFVRRPEVLEALGLLSGEYAQAVFPVEGNPALGVPPFGGAMWLHTTDPARVIDGLDILLRTLDTPRENPVIAELLAQGLISNADIDNFAESMTVPGMERSETTLNGFDVISWHVEGIDDVFAYGVLSDDVAFLAIAPGAAEVVTAAAHGDGVLPQSAGWPEDVYAEYGPDGEMLLYLDIGRLAESSGSSEIMAALESMMMGLDLQDNGLFQLRMTLVRTGE